MNFIHSKNKCPECGRKILVIMTSIGSPHQFVNQVICGECLLEKGLNEAWVKANPEEAEEIETWIRSSE